MRERKRERVREKKKESYEMHIHLYVMDTIVLYVTSHMESVFIYVSPNTMQN